MMTSIDFEKSWYGIIFALLALAAGGAVGFLVGFDFDLRYILGAVAAGIAGLLILQKPEWGLYILVGVVYTNLSDVGIKYYGLPSIVQLMIPALLGVIWIRWFLYGERPQWWERAAVLLGLWTTLAFSSMLYAANYARAQAGFVDLLKNSVIALIVILFVRRARIFRNVIWLLLIVGIFIGTINTFQFLTSTFANDYWGFAQADATRAVGSAGDVRISGPLGSNNFFAQIMLVLIPLALDRLWHERQLPLRLLAGWALVVVSLTVVFTFSRGGFLAVATMFIAIFIVNPPRLHHIIITLILGVGLLQFLPASYTERLTSLTEIFSQGSVEDLQLEDRSFRGRASEMLAAWYMFLDYPVLGVGLGNYNYYYQDYSEDIGLDIRRDARSAHSLYLEIAAEKGLAGIILFGAIMLMMYSSLFRASYYFKLAQMEDYYNMTFAFGVGLLGYFVAAVFLHDAFPRFFWLFFGLALVLPHVAEYEYQLQQSPDTDNTHMTEEHPALEPDGTSPLLES